MRLENLEPVSVINPLGRSDWLFVCEHASNHIPAQLKDLGLSAKYLEQHIAYDIGAKSVTLQLAKLLDATAIICNYSRLVIDCNRAISMPDFIPEQSDSIMIPRNQHISNEEKQDRVNKIYHPFHQVVAQVLTDKLIKNNQTKFGNIHSFTPMLSEQGIKRPWDLGFVYKDESFVKKIMNRIQLKSSLEQPIVIGKNEPYNGFIHKGYTIPAHAEAQDIPSFLVELRQDNIGDEIGQNYWAGILADTLMDLK